MANTFNAITSGAGGIATTGDSSGAFSFTKDGGSAEVYIDSSGNVGIGTSSPSHKLDITSSSGVQLGIASTGASAGFQAFTNAGSYTVGAVDYTSSAMIFYTGNGVSGAPERMRITANGGVAFGGASNYGTSGQVLTSNGDAAPTWGSATPTTAQVQTAMAGSAVGDLGTYAFLRGAVSTALSTGSNYAGSALVYCGGQSTGGGAGTSFSYGGNGSALSGTWKCMGSSSTSAGYYGVTLFLRIA